MKRIRVISISLLAVVVLALAGCATTTSDQSTDTGVDTDAIAATVAAELRIDLEGALTDVSPSDPAAVLAAENNSADQIAEAVMAEVSAQLAAQPTAAPTADANTPALASSDLQNALVDVYQQANQAVVYIIVPPLGSGSGFVFDDAGHIVTNNHVVDGGSSYEIVFASGERRAATLVGTDADSDLAVLQVEDMPQEVIPLPLGSIDGVQVGEFAVAIGNPFGEQGSMSLGIVSALGRSLPSQRTLGNGGSYSLPEVIQTDAPINPGNSGGPLLNLDGEVIGVNSAIVSTTGTNSGVGYAIPVEAVRQIVPSLIAEGEHVYPLMGAVFDDEVSLADLDVYGIDQTRGAYVVAVSPGGPAEAAGLIGADPTTGSGGDLVVAIDDRPVNNFGDLNSYLVFRTRAGQEITLTVLRDGETIVVPLTLGARP